MMRQRMMQQMKSQQQQQQQQQLQPQQHMQQQQMLQPQPQPHQQQQPPPGSEDTTSNDAYSSEVLTKPNGGIGIKIKIKKAAEPQSDKSSNVSKKAKRDEESTNLPPIQQSSELQNSHTAGQTAVDTRPQKSQQSAAQSEGPIRENNQSPAQSQQRHSTGQPFLTQHAQMTSKQQQSNQQEQQPQQQQQQLPHQPGQQSQQQAQQQQQQQQPQQLPQPPP